MNSLNKTFLPTTNSKNRNWFVVDCKEQKLGRIATIIVALLKGKIKPYYFPSTDIGDYVILINADLIRINKKNKHYIVSNPGRPGNSLKVKNVSDCLPKFTIKRTIKGMLSETETKRLLRRLYIYNDENHCHQAQNPIEIDIADFYNNSEFSDRLTKLIK